MSVRAHMRVCVCPRMRARVYEWARAKQRGERENSKTLFYKDCSLSSVKNLFDN